jgi:hypothetical protein
VSTADQILFSRRLPRRDLPCPGARPPDYAALARFGRSTLTVISYGKSRHLSGGRTRLDYLESVDTSQAVTWAIALLALVVSGATYRLNVRDKRYAWKGQEQEQAEEVAGWLAREMCEEHAEMEWKAYLRNSSRSPVYDVLYVVHDSQDLDAAMPEMIPLIPPDTTWDFFPTWFGDQPEGNPQVYMTFRDKRGKAWQRDTHGRLTPFRRNIDNAPPADPISGRISYGMTELRSGASIGKYLAAALPGLIPKLVVRPGRKRR